MAGQIPRSFIDDLLARLDIVDIIDARGILKKKGKIVINHYCTRMLEILGWQELNHEEGNESER